MRVLVTGGAGYIGSVVTEALVARGDEVVVYDDLSKGHRDAIVDEAVFVHGDLLDRAALEGALRHHRVEAVVHMAAASLVGESVRDPARYYRQNVIAGLVLLDALHACDIRPLVFSSTAAVYGEPAKQPIEESDPTAPTSPYGATKLAFEDALRWYDGAYGLRYASLRYFNAAGATARNAERHDPETHLVPLVLDAAAGAGPEVVVYGDDYPTRDGTCVRDYIHVVDLADAHLRALDALRSQRPSRVYNLGCGGQGYTVREVIAAAERVTGRRIPWRVGPRRPGDPAVLLASSARIAGELGWVPQQRGLDDIVASAWAWRVAHGVGAPV
ncbi:MAG: UDP-glucose 4-epimerase GalE [Pseudomonadota bacterium]|nr:UDP-glucose 4-epimerase GalE [Pseudomonadota bacterium]